jgi:hypothetical protein
MRPVYDSFRTSAPGRWAFAARGVATLLAAGLVLALGLGPASVVEAQAKAETQAQAGGTGDSAAYREVITEALQQYERGYFAEAHASFRRAHAMYPNARTHWGLGVTAFEARQYVEAITQLEAGLAHADKPLSAAQRTTALSLIERAKGYAATLSVKLTPAEAELMINGVRKVDAQAAQALRVDPGDHELVASAAGYQTLTRRVRVQSGDDTALELVLAKQTAAGAPVAAAAPATAAQEAAGSGSSSGRRRSIGPYLVMGAGGAALVSAIVTGVMAKGAESDLTEACDDDGVCDPSQQATIDRGERTKLATNVLLGVGSAAVAGGLLWFVFDRPARETAPRADLSCAPDGCRLDVRGRF